MAAEQNSNTGPPLTYVVTPPSASVTPPSASLHIEPGRYEVTVNLVTTVSTATNASFDEFVREFTKRISDKAAEVFGHHTRTTIPKGT